MLYRVILLLAGIAILAACSSAPVQKPVHGEAYESNQLVQSDANRMANLIMRDNLDSLALLLDKFYKRNPREWRKTADSAEQARALVMTRVRMQQAWPGLAGKNAIQLLPIPFDPDFAGDRAGLLVYALGRMLIELYGGRTTLYMVHGVDAQRTENAVANIEAVMWLLASRQDKSGAPLLLSNEIGSQGRNLSFEREFGRMLGRLEMMAEMNDEKYRRAAINFLQGIVAGPLLQFLPVEAATAAAH